MPQGVNLVFLIVRIDTIANIVLFDIGNTIVSY